MLRGRFAIALVTALAVMLLASWLWRDEDGPTDQVPAPADNTPAANGVPVRPVAGDAAGSRDGPLSPGVDTDSPADAKPADPMRSQLQDVASAYREASRYPAWSQPLQADDWDRLNPRAFVPRETPLDGYPQVTASIELERYLVDVSMPVAVQVVVASPSPAASAVSVSLLGPQGRTGSIALAAQPPGSGLQVFSGVIPASVLAGVGEGEAGIEAMLAMTDGEAVTITSQLKVYVPEARLLYLGTPYVDGATLVIPAHFEVAQPGYYRVRANLFEQENERPVAHLSDAFMLDAQNRSGLLRVHAETLRAMQAPGPYLLTDFDITRSPARPGDKTGYGSSAKPAFPLTGFSLDSYSDEPFVDEASQQRQQFLDKLSGQQGGQ